MRNYINSERDLFKKPVYLDEGLTFDLPRTLKKIDRYYLSKFMSSEYDNDGFKKIFYNKNKRPLKASQKAVDVDTKDIKIKAVDGQSYYPAWFMNKELKQFMKDEGFDKLLNQITERYPKYGEVIVKNVNGVPYCIHLKNLKWDPANHVENSSFIHEFHSYSLSEFLVEAEDKGWENIDKIRDLLSHEENKNVYLVERTGWFKESELKENGSNTKIVFGMALLTDTDNNENKLPDLVLTKKELKENPYRSLSWEEQDGRGLGIGVIEELFEFQEFYNDVNNKERKSLEWNSKKLFRSDDPNISKNLFLAKKNGDVIETKDLQEIPMAERNLGQYINLYQRIDGDANGTTFTHEINTGQAMKAGTPFRMGALLSGAVDSYFEFKREKLGIFLQGIILDFVLPSFKKKKRKSHILNFDSNSEDIRKIDDLVKNEMLRKSVEKFEKKNGKLPSLIEYANQKTRIEELLARKQNRFIEIPEGMYDKANILVDIVITGEQENTEADIASLTNLYQILVQKQDPRADDVLDKALMVSGHNPVGFKKSAVATPQPQTPTGLPALAPQQ